MADKGLAPLILWQKALSAFGACLFDIDRLKIKAYILLLAELWGIGNYMYIIWPLKIIMLQMGARDAGESLYSIIH